MKEILNSYYENNGERLHKVVDGILSKFGGISNKDHDDFYSIANEVFADAMKRYDQEQSFEGFLYSCLSNKIRTEITRRNRDKRKTDRYSISLDTPVGENQDLRISDFLYSDFDMDLELERLSDYGHNERIEKYLGSLSNIQRQIIEMKMEEIPTSQIKRQLDLSKKEYEKQCQELKSFAKVSILYGNGSITDLGITRVSKI